MKKNFEDFMLVPEAFVDSKIKVDLLDENDMYPVMSNGYLVMEGEKQKGYAPVKQDYSFDKTKPAQCSIQDLKLRFMHFKLDEIENTYYVYVTDNPHYKETYDTIRFIKSTFGDKVHITIAGVNNIITFEQYAKINVDIIGLGTFDSVPALILGIGYPLAELIIECSNLGYKSKIMVMMPYHDVNWHKAFACGADMIMCNNLWVSENNLKQKIHHVVVACKLLGAKNIEELKEAQFVEVRIKAEEE